MNSNLKCYVDGFEPAECIAFEYHGNFWHTCPDCRALGKFDGVSNEELDKRFNDTKEKKKRIERLYKYVCKWSCGHEPILD
jgi:hypothetical protein